MTTQTAAQITYRRTRQGEWVAFGPVSQLHVGVVQVAKRDGSVKSETIVRVGRTFQADGVECAYGYFAPRQSQRSTSRGRGWSIESDDHEDCGSFSGCLLGDPSCPFHSRRY